MSTAGGAAGVREVSEPPATTGFWPLRAGIVITLATVLAFALRIFPLSRPGYLTGFTQYDDGVYLGNALRLFHGAIAYRDFAMVQPPASMLLMAPAALAAKLFGAPWGLAAARLLTAGADTANVVLIGLLVRHRGSLAAALACGGYAIYPAALNASQTLLLEPWLNLFCLLAAVLVFRSSELAGPRRLAWGGACFGFAVAIKIWAFAPVLLVAGCCLRQRRGRWFAGGFAAGLALPCLPFLVLAPSGFGRTVFVSELVQSTHGRFGPRLRLADITGLIGLNGLTGRSGFTLGAAIAGALVIGLLIALAWVQDVRTNRPGLTPLDWYVASGVVVVTVLMFVPSEWYEHYAAFDGPFVVLALALPLARLAAAPRFAAPRFGSAEVLVMAAAGLVVVVMSLAAVGAAVRLEPVRNLAAADRIIAPGACVVTDTASATIAVNRFSASSPGCPALVDSVGTMIATTDGQDQSGQPSVLNADTSVWRAAFGRAQYVWLVGLSGDTSARIAWTGSLLGYFDHHFRLLRFASSFRGRGDVPRGGLYGRI